MEVMTETKLQKKNPEIAYTMTLAFGIVLEVKASANAWWMDQQKLHTLIAAFKIDATIPEACFAADITVKQYKYFVRLHPEFNEARKGYRLTGNLLAKRTIFNNLDKWQVAWRWLVKKCPEEFGSPSRQRALQERNDLRMSSEFLEDSEIKELTKEYEDKLRMIIARKRTQTPI